MNKLQELKTQYLQYLKWRFPSVPEYALVPPNYMDKSKTTNGLTQCIISHFHLLGWQAERVSSSGRMIDNTKQVKDILGRTKMIGSKKWIKGTSQAGTADISASPMGRIVKIEVKNSRTKDRMNREQERYREQIELSGGVYYIATDYEEAAIWIDENFQENPHREKFWQQWKMKPKNYQQIGMFDTLDFSKKTDF